MITSTSLQTNAQLEARRCQPTHICMADVVAQSSVVNRRIIRSVVVPQQSLNNFLVAGEAVFTTDSPTSPAAPHAHAGHPFSERRKEGGFRQNLRNLRQEQQVSPWLVKTRARHHAALLRAPSRSVPTERNRHPGCQPRRQPLNPPDAPPVLRSRTCPAREHSPSLPTSLHSDPSGKVGPLQLSSTALVSRFLIR